MECNNFQQKLSDYIEGIISSEELALIEEHLKTCSTCNKSFADIKKTLSYARDLEDIEPPAWLRDKIMSRIKTETDPKGGFLRKLFYPLHIKLPIEAVAAVFVAVTAFYIFKTIQPEVKIARVPSEEIKTQIPQPPAPPLEKGPATSSVESGNGGFQTEQPVQPAPMDKSAEEPQVHAQDTRWDKVTPSEGVVGKEESKTEILSTAAKSKVLAEKKEAVSLHLRVEDVKTAREEIEKTLIQFEGKITKIESFENKELVTAEIDSQKLKEFIDNLKHIGEIKEKESTFESHKRNIQIRIEIVKIVTQP